jgi:DNA-binding NtrC family response regulator
MAQSYQILVVDDEPRGAELMARTLRRFGSVERAESAEAAWELIQESRFDLVISDQRMPKMSGVELLTRVADLDDSIGRVLITAYSDLKAATDAINRGRVHAYLPKPCLPDKLRDCADAVLKRTQQGRETASLLTELAEKNRKLAEAVRQASAMSGALGEDETD